MEEFYNIGFSGVLIGVLVSAPMGPVGMLCIQRTLNNGRWAGFFTGVGAGISDVFYCLLAGLSLSFITDFINTHTHWLEIIGSAVLAAFALYLFKKNPSRALKKTDEKKSNIFADIMTGFLFTVSNPLILFFIIGLYGRFNFLLPDYSYYHYIAGYLCIFAGTLLWWFFITFVVNKLRTHFNVRSLWVLNRIVGSILFIMAAVGVYNGISGLSDNPNKVTMPDFEELILDKVPIPGAKNGKKAAPNKSAKEKSHKETVPSDSLPSLYQFLK